MSDLENELLGALLVALPYVTDVLDNPAQLACFKKGVVQKDAKMIRAAIDKGIRKEEEDSSDQSE